MKFFWKLYFSIMVITMSCFSIGSYMLIESGFHATLEREVENAYHENERCKYCYERRLLKTAKKAKELGMDAFSSSLLYSKMQNHEVIKELAEKAAKEYNIPFYYYDFREGWQEGIDISKKT